MLIIVTEPCGCGPFDKEHTNPNCIICKERKQVEEKMEEIINNFKQDLEGE